MIYIVYSEKKFVTDEQIETWFADATANGEIDPTLLGARTVTERASALSDAGIITMANPQNGLPL